MHKKLNVKSRIRHVIHALNNSEKGVLEIVIALMVCDFIICGVHAYGQKIHVHKISVVKRQTHRALADGNVLRPTVSIRAKNDFAHKFSRINESLPEVDRVKTSLLIAQAGLESNWGSSTLYQKANNPFGVKGDYHGDYMSYYTGEDDDNGKSHLEMADFRQYPSLADAVKDHNQLLKKQFLQGSGDDYVSQAKALQDNGYATDPNYARKLMDYVQKNNLTRFD